MKTKRKHVKLFISLTYQKNGAFTIIEFLVALTISTFLILLLYKVYGQVLDVYHIKSKAPLKDWFYLSESLESQLSRLSKGKTPPFFLFKEGKLLFVTHGGYSGGAWLVGYFPGEEKRRVLYLEKPYLGYRLPRNIEDLINEESEKKNFYELPYFELHLYKILNGDNKEPLEEARGLSSGIYALEIKTKGFERIIYFSFGRIKNCW